MSIEVISGEKIQMLCNLYLGYNEDFNFNPIIKDKKSKHLSLDNINTPFNNPKLIFCYTHRIINLHKKIKYFLNPFILISHNSDYSIDDNTEVNYILNNKNLIKWFSQNISFTHKKLELLPIGIANRMWSHGNIDLFYNLTFINNIKKNKLTYFNFNVHTNINKRQSCYKSLIKKISWLENIEPNQNIIRLSEYKFCICPEGNGYDTHRLWECLYLNVVPIVKNSPFTKILIKYNIPLVILDEWDDYDENLLNYDNYDFNSINIYNFDKLKDIILNAVAD